MMNLMSMTWLNEWEYEKIPSLENIKDKIIKKIVIWILSCRLQLFWPVIWFL